MIPTSGYFDSSFFHNLVRLNNIFIKDFDENDKERLIKCAITMTLGYRVHYMIKLGSKISSKSLNNELNKPNRI